MDDIDKYVLEQAKLEVEHTRSWPTKVLAFYVAINAGVVTALFALASRASGSVRAHWCIKALITFAIAALSVWVLALIVKNHLSYLRHRGIQVHFQRAHAEPIKAKFPVPAEWLLPIVVSLRTRPLGWTFYAYLVLLVGALGITGVWVS